MGECEGGGAAEGGEAARAAAGGKGKKKGALNAFRDVSSCNSYNYGDAVYWDARYINEAGSFDWYQRYSALRPFVRHYIPTSSNVLMVGCGNAVMSEDMVKDGYEEIMNIDISSVVIDIMIKKYENIPQLRYMQMDVRDMSFFPDESFDCVIDKGTLDSLMCGTTAPISVCQMLGEVNRLLKPGGIYMLITYGDPTVRIPHLNRPGYCWKVILYIICCSNSSFSFPWQPDQDSRGQGVLVLHQTRTWIQFLLLTMVASLQILFWRILILTLFMYAKRRMGL